MPRPLLRETRQNLIPRDLRILPRFLRRQHALVDHLKFRQLDDRPRRRTIRRDRWRAPNQQQGTTADTEQTRNEADEQTSSSRRESRRKHGEAGTGKLAEMNHRHRAFLTSLCNVLLTGNITHANKALHEKAI